MTGAIWWAVAKVILGPCIDQWGFGVMYIASIFAAILNFIVITSYLRANDRNKYTHSFPPNQQLSNNLPALQTPNNTHTLAQLLLTICAGCYGHTFIFSLVALNSGTTIVENLSFLYFDTLGATAAICGLTVVITVAFEIPIFQVSSRLQNFLRRGQWGQSFATVALQTTACLTYAVRVWGYSMLTHSNRAIVILLLLSEPLHGVTYACGKLAAMEFVDARTPKGSEASAQGFLSLFQGLGTVLGLYGGGYLEDLLGAKIMYRIFGGLVLMFMLVFLVGATMFRDGEAVEIQDKKLERSSLNRNAPTSYSAITDGVQLPDNHDVL